MSLIVKIGKKGKAVVKRLLSPVETHRVSYTRRIERVRTDRRIVAMTFDDGPADIPCSPDLFEGRSLTDVILDVLEEFGAKGTFDVIGDTSENYPDEAGAPGTAAWGGIRYDHYPE
ncbi:MAG: polysaccharide deacetylase family protein, partial [Clostridia bacterium]|nr:polysaccharide deacetylase family protein [Clostridia bacterium]